MACGFFSFKGEWLGGWVRRVYVPAAQGSVSARSTTPLPHTHNPAHAERIYFSRGNVKPPAKKATYTGISIQSASRKILRTSLVCISSGPHVSLSTVKHKSIKNVINY
eukprot:GEMP01095143.1.p1 GENE.GEMP01095143.1~~GEMP01095143.1.p1  ORF type:complete len:108 (+),score=8.52 GEMP01095143.1:144-467(+)